MTEPPIDAPAPIEAPAPIDAPALIAHVRELPGGPELLELARGRDIQLVGGAVRDLLLGRDPRELDVVVGAAPTAGAPSSNPAALFARELIARLNAHAHTQAPADGHARVTANAHERFGTALLEWDGARIDVACRRAESYPAPGALPDVRGGTLEEDLLRRDFTVNAIAVNIGSRPGEVFNAVPGALEDLRAGRLRVLHDASFRDDPTRLLRLARYAARLRFEIEPHTARLAHEAVRSRALDTVSGSRIGAELRLALNEPDPVATLAVIDRLGLIAALHPRMRLDRPALERALALLPADSRPDLLAMASLTLPLALRARENPRAEIVALLDRLEFTAHDRDPIAAAAAAVPRLTEELPSARRPSQLRAAIAGLPSEGVALAGALSQPATDPARQWLDQLRHVRLAITGDDLLAAGIPEGPELGRRLDAVLDMRLDGLLAPGPGAELAAALEVSV